MSLYRTGPDAWFFVLTETVRFGTCWSGYMPFPIPERRRILSTALSPGFVHAAGDSYTRDYLTKIGIGSVSTSCPTT